MHVDELNSTQEVLHQPLTATATKTGSKFHTAIIFEIVVTEILKYYDMGRILNFP
jgi:hypothetical protein